MNSLSQIQSLTIPMPNSAWSVNIYAIEGPEGYYLIDAGIATEQARMLIKQWVPRPLAGILLTHGHQDHLGLAGELAQEQGCPVYLHSGEYQRLQNSELQIIKIGQLLTMGGFSKELLNEAIEAYQITRQNNILKLAGAELRELTSEQKFSTELGILETIHTPGHTIGHCCFYLTEKKQLFSGDHILVGISPNPILDIGTDVKRRLALVEYLKSLEKIASLSVEKLYPGHGQPFDRLDKVLEQFYDYHLKRQQLILQNLSQYPQTPFQIVEKIYPGVRGLNIFLAISRVWGYLDLLDLEGQIMVQIKDNTTYYSLH